MASWESSKSKIPGDQKEHEGLSHLFHPVEYYTSDVNHCLISDLLDSDAPLTIKTTRLRWSAPWFTAEACARKQTCRTLVDSRDINIMHITF